MAKEKVTELFGSMVFNEDVMKQRLSATCYRAWKKCVEEGTPLSLETAHEMAAEMKNWAMDRGATHYTHWFQPMTGVTAEKHDSFITPENPSQVLMSFSGKELVRGEPDASSFPSGGLRATFEARGYTAWDPTSFAFIKDGSLCIPTVFCSYSGQALDKKTPLLRSMDELSRQAVRVLRLFGDTDVKKVVSQVGPEQEYFLIDKDVYDKREDLILTGRTLFGAKPPKGQELEDHYFGTIKPRVAAYMKELDEELWKLGILAKTQHNEVAPAQHELAPIYTTVNIATDHNQLTMEIMKKVAKRHGLTCLLHEKPFAGLNGSGKHNNWSLGTDTGTLLFAPGKTVKDNLQFITFTVNVMAAVHRHNGLLKASIASATNAHRLGANEAPPAIISIFTGTQLANILDHIAKSTNDELTDLADKEGISVGVNQIPEILVDATDRNRTSPFAFTGNRFEFRAVGSSANCASAMIALNAAVAEQLTEFKAKVDQRIAAGETLRHALLEEIRALIISSDPIHFDGNGYSDEWKEEAARRGLDCETSVPLIFDAYLKPESVAMFKNTGVFNEVELQARNEVKWEMYTKKIQIEARVLGDLAINHILPVATRYQSVLLDNVYKIRSVFAAEKADSMAAEDMYTIERIAEHIRIIKEETAEMIRARKVANRIESEREKAIAYHDTVLPRMDTIRYHIDKLELMVDNEIWPLPKYRELLFIR